MTRLINFFRIVRTSSNIQCFHKPLTCKQFLMRYLVLISFDVQPTWAEQISWLPVLSSSSLAVEHQLHSSKHLLCSQQGRQLSVVSLQAGLTNSVPKLWLHGFTLIFKKLVACIRQDALELLLTYMVWICCPRDTNCADHCLLWPASDGGAWGQDHEQHEGGGPQGDGGQCEERSGCPTDGWPNSVWTNQEKSIQIA